MCKAKNGLLGQGSNLELFFVAFLVDDRMMNNSNLEFFLFLWTIGNKNTR
jgi:hypothetical protein